MKLRAAVWGAVAEAARARLTDGGKIVTGGLILAAACRIFGYQKVYLLVEEGVRGSKWSYEVVCRPSSLLEPQTGTRQSSLDRSSCWPFSPPCSGPFGLGAGYVPLGTKSKV